jgi:hypothetical protein
MSPQKADIWEGPLFIIGVDRSGTTLLRLILTSHPLVSIPPESLFIIMNEKKFNDSTDLRPKIDDFIESLYQDVKFTEWNLDKHLLKLWLLGDYPLSYPETVKKVYLFYANKSKPSAIIWGDKNPTNIYNVPKLLKLFPKAKFIHIIRDIRAIYNSLNRKEIRDNWGIKEDMITFSSNRWAQSFKIVSDYFGDENFYTVYYEDLVRHPVEVTGKICDFIQVPFDPVMLDFYKNNQLQELVPPNRKEWHQLTFEPVTGKRIDAWKKQLTKKQIMSVELENYELMCKFGYRCMTPLIKYKFLRNLFRRITEKKRLQKD